MDTFCKSIIREQFGAAIKTLENAILVCPDDLWDDDSTSHPIWYVTYHTLFWLDYYLSESTDDYTPPEPFTLSELNPKGELPERAYTKDELLSYLDHGREKCKATIDGLTDERAERHFKFGRLDFSFAELLLYNLRHVQHHAAQLNLILRQRANIGSRWVFRSEG